MIKSFDKQAKEQGFSFSNVSDEEYTKQAQNTIDELIADPSKMANLRISDPDIAEAI